jgi:hypothetical protein
MENPVQIFADVYKRVHEITGYHTDPTLIGVLANVALNLTAIEIQWQASQEQTKLPRRVMAAPPGMM